MKVYTDGACRGNPGPAAFAFIISTVPETRKAGYIGIATNNRAEYIAIIEALRTIKSLKIADEIELFTDSELVVRQLLGEYEIKNAALKLLNHEVLTLAEDIVLVPTHVPRSNESIAECDAMCNKILDQNKEKAW